MHGSVYITLFSPNDMSLLSLRKSILSSRWSSKKLKDGEIDVRLSTSEVALVDCVAVANPRVTPFLRLLITINNNRASRRYRIKQH